jgi:hypothetical protein
MRSSLRKQLSILVQKRLHIERRGGKRIVPVRRTLCLMWSPDRVEPTTAIVQNLSHSGIAVQSEDTYATGTLLRLLLVNDAHTFSLAVEMSVVRCVRIGNHNLIAGPFARALLHQELVPFIL